jgi:hypothetical protein
LALPFFLKMVRFSLHAILAIATLSQASAFRACSVPYKVLSSASAGRGARLHAVAVKSPVGFPRPITAKDDEEKAGAMIDLSGIVLSVSHECFIHVL